MTRFYKGQKEHPMRRLVLSVCLFLAVGICFYIGINSVSARTEMEQKQSLTQSIQRGISHCYATEGHYPQDLEYLQKTYGIQYDEDKYFVDYQVRGSNIMPDVTIMER